MMFGHLATTELTDVGHFQPGFIDRQNVPPAEPSAVSHLVEARE